jgi:hypothetical protein
MTLDAGLRESGRIEGFPRRDSFVTDLAYRMPDASLVLIGNAIHKFWETYTPEIMHLNATLSESHRLGLEKGSPFVPTYLWYGCPTGDGGAIATVQPQAQPKSRDTDAPPVTNGAVLDVVGIGER